MLRIQNAFCKTGGFSNDGWDGNENNVKKQKV